MQPHRDSRHINWYANSTRTQHYTAPTGLGVLGPTPWRLDRENLTAAELNELDPSVRADVEAACAKVPEPVLRPKKVSSR